MKSVCRRFLFRAIPLALLAGAAAAQDILPSGGFVRGWEAAGRPRSFIEKDLFNHINGGAELFLEFGFARLLVQPYAGGGKDELVLEVYEMTEPAAALGIYLMSAGRETPWPEIPARNSSEEAQIVAVKGRYFLKVEHYDSGPGLRPDDRLGPECLVPHPGRSPGESVRRPPGRRPRRRKRALDPGSGRPPAVLFLRGRGYPRVGGEDVRLPGRLPGRR